MTMASHNELAIARAFLQHSIKFVLPPQYRQNVVGEMRVIGVDAMKLTKTKAVLIVKFLTPQSLKDSTMQMCCTDLEPRRGLGQGADLIIRTAIRYTLPQAKSLYDIGVRVMSAAYITRAMLADFDNMKGESVSDATQVGFLDIETLEQNHKGTIFDQCVTQLLIPKPPPILNTMTKSCVAPCAENGSKIKVSRCKDFKFGVEVSFRKSYGHLTLHKTELSALISATRLKGKGMDSTNVKSNSLFKVVDT